MTYVKSRVGLLNATVGRTKRLLARGRRTLHELRLAKERRIAKQIARASRLQEQVDGLELWQTPLGLYWVAAQKLEAFCLVLAEQQLDFYGSRRSGVHARDIVIDGGAHFGGFVKKALDRRAELVVAVEPSPTNLECLRRNYAKEIQAGRVIPVPKGLWDGAGMLVLETSRSTLTDRLVEREKRFDDLQVPVATLDGMVADLRLPRVDFIKLDIEGAERKALRGAAATLSAFKPRLAVAAYHLPDDREVLPPLVLAARPDYKCRLKGKGWGSLTVMCR